MLFTWLKNRVRQAVVDGVSEAVNLLQQGDADDKALPLTLPASLAVKLLPAAPLPSPAGPEAAGQEEAKGKARGRKAE